MNSEILSRLACYLAFVNAKDSVGQNIDVKPIVEATLAGAWRLMMDGTKFAPVWGGDPRRSSQTGRTNHVDNDRVVGSLGFGHYFSLGGQQFRLGVTAQLHALLSKTTRKQMLENYPACTTDTSSLCDESQSLSGLQTGNPGFPGYSHGGYFSALTLGLRWVFDAAQ